MIEVLVFVTQLACPPTLVARRFENKTKHVYELSVLVGEDLVWGTMKFAGKSGVTICLPREAWMVTKRLP